MDAAYKHFNKTVLFLATALLMVVPGRAQTTFVLAGGASPAAVTLFTNQYVPVTVAASDGSSITFTTSISDTSAHPTGLTWLGITGGLTTPTTLYFSIVTTGNMVAGQTYTATVTLTSGTITGVINVAFTNGSGSGGGTLTPSQTSVTLSAASGSSTSAQITLTNNTGNTLTFPAPTVGTTSGGNWLAAAVSANTLAASAFATLTISVPNGLTLASGTYYGTVTIMPSGGGSSTQIGVTFTVGTGGTGNLTASPNPISWTFTTGSGVYPAIPVCNAYQCDRRRLLHGQREPFQFLAVSQRLATTTSGNFTSGSVTITISPSASAMSSLTTGATGYVYVTDSNNNPVTITVNLSVNGSGTVTGITWSPNSRDPIRRSGWEHRAADGLPDQHHGRHVQ